MKKIIALRALVQDGADQGGDYHAKPTGHWINSTVIATPMSKYPEYQQTRTSFGIDVLGTVLVEVEASDGTVGFAMTTGGVPAAYIIEKHFRRFVVGQPAHNLERMFDQMYHASLFYGRKGLVINAISAVDCAVWDLLGKLRQEPVFAMIGGQLRERQPMYATGPRPDLAQKMGFIGGKIPLPYGPAHGDEGLRANLELAADMRARVGPDFMLAFDCWMALTPAYSLRLIEGLRPFNFRWIEECLPPDDYAGYRQLVEQRTHPIQIATGEHEYTRWGFEQLLGTGVDMVQPDIHWCGGLTELLKIKALASARNRLCVLHGSSVYSYHFAIASDVTPFSEFLMMAPQADKIVPMFSPLFTNETVPVDGHVTVSEAPGFGVDLNPALKWSRPFPTA
ncbi:MAG TPA: L-rhamnonate dehydratase [Opitutaceae bacterium]|nr:L-rhamnonate dehydratase [Opitutaceae bacterium]